jgi:Tfp pilus assembly protein PilV
MKLIGKESSQGRANKSNRPAGFTLMEVMIGVLILGLAIISLFALLGSGFAIVRFNRDNLRATQIMLNRVEGLRLYNWGQLTTENLVPTNFTEYYYPSGTNSQGTVFSGTVTIANAIQNPTSTYSSNMMRYVTIRVNWTTGFLPHSRQVSTYVSEYGVQNYVFSN